MKGQAKLILSIIVLIIIAIFALQNTASVTLDLIFNQFQTPLVLIILFSLLIGVIVGLIVSATQATAKNAEVKNLKNQLAVEKENHQREISDLNRQIAELRAAANVSEQQRRNTAVAPTMDV